MFRLKKPLAKDMPFTNSSSVTVVLTNWRRPKNVRVILDSLSGQTMKPHLFLWNNGAEFSHQAVTWQVDSSYNMMCWPRWWMASCAQTEYVCIVDDDLMFLDDHVLEDMIKALQHCSEKTIVGLFGMILDPAKEYRYGTQVRPSEEDQCIDIVKGRCMMMRTSALRSVSFQPKPTRSILMCEDILVSGVLAGGEAGKHLVPKGFASRWKELPNEHSLHKMPSHWEQREIARRQFFSM